MKHFNLSVHFPTVKMFYLHGICFFWEDFEGDYPRLKTIREDEPTGLRYPGGALVHFVNQTKTGQIYEALIADFLLRKSFIKYPSGKKRKVEKIMGLVVVKDIPYFFLTTFTIKTIGYFYPRVRLIEIPIKLKGKEFLDYYYYSVMK